MKRVLLIFKVIILLSSCSDSGKILVGHDFEKGDWLFVNVNYAEKTLQIIEDKTILIKNKKGIWVTPAGECGATTCDGFLKLYKDGKLIAQEEYLARATVYESSEIKENYKDGYEWTINPNNEVEFKQVWDSLRNTGNYPTIYHTQPVNKDIIWAYRIK